jgi:hypothetical protein
MLLLGVLVPTTLLVFMLGLLLLLLQHGLLKYIPIPHLMHLRPSARDTLLTCAFFYGLQRGDRIHPAHTLLLVLFCVSVSQHNPIWSKHIRFHKPFTPLPISHTLAPILLPFKVLYSFLL